MMDYSTGDEVNTFYLHYGNIQTMCLLNTLP